MSQSRTGISRRRILAAGGGLAIAAVVDGAAAASVPSSPRFDLTQTSHDLFRDKPLSPPTVMQSFTFDNDNHRLFVAQLADGTGNLYVTQLDFSGNQVGQMSLTGFGHGVSIGVEPVGTDSFLWTEVDAVDGWGTRLARFRFVDGATIDHTSNSLRKHQPITGVDRFTCAVDPVNQRLVVRYRTSDKQFRFAAYDIADVRAGIYSRRLADIAQPAGLGTFQGYTAYGEYLYLLDGDPYDPDTNPPPGNAFVNSVSLNGGPLTREPTNAGGSLIYREPEGMAIYRTVAGQPRLFLGFASGDPGDRRCNIFYKNALV
jgi:hypothetical protein